VLNDPIGSVDPDGRCTVPAGLKAGQVGICVEAFIAAPRIGGIGRGDNRTFQSNDPDATARMRTSMILSATSTTIDKKVTEERVSDSVVGVTLPSSLGSYTANIPLPATGDITSDENSTALQGTEGFGDGNTSTMVNIGLRNGTNGGQVLGNKIIGAAIEEGLSGDDVGFYGGMALGGMIKAAAPAGTIDVAAQIRITGSGDNIRVTGHAQARLYPSVVGYAYVGQSDGSVRAILLFHHDETQPSDLTKPMRPIN
jgi:hypothetical protein